MNNYDIPVEFDPDEETRLNIESAIAELRDPKSERRRRFEEIMLASQTRRVLALEGERLRPGDGSILVY